jgi:membrane-associated protease RseP (regulator of RpoE activity)
MATTLDLPEQELKTKDNKTFVGVFWFNRDFDNKPVNRMQIFGGEEIDPSKGFEHKFRLPLPKSLIYDVFQIRFEAQSDVQRKCEISHLLVQSTPVPMIGVDIKEKSSVVFANMVSPGTPAEKAGLHAGDIILSINGQEPKTAKDALNLFGQVALGNTITVKIRRGKQDQEAKVVVE